MSTFANKCVCAVLLHCIHTNETCCTDRYIFFMRVVFMQKHNLTIRVKSVLIALKMISVVGLSVIRLLLSSFPFNFLFSFVFHFHLYCNVHKSITNMYFIYFIHNNCVRIKSCEKKARFVGFL